MSRDRHEGVEPNAEIKDLEPHDDSEEVRGGRRPPRDPEPTPPTPGGPVPIPYPNT